MAWKKILFVIGFFPALFGLPGMMEDWQVWKQWFADWRWYNFLTVSLGLVLMSYGASPFIARLSGELRMEKLRSVLNYKLWEESTVKEAILAVLLLPPLMVVLTVLVVVVLGLGLTILFKAFGWGIWILEEILEIF